MADRPDDEEKGEDTSTREETEGGSINDPLTRTDVEAPRKEFGAGD